MTVRANWSIAAAFLGALACAKGAERRLPGESAQPSYAVVGEAETRRLWSYLAGCSGQDTVGLSPAWTPSDILAARIDSLVRPAVDSALLQKNSSIRAADYHIHYYGVYRDAAALVVANAVDRRLLSADSMSAHGGDSARSRNGAGWLATPSIPCDVGPAYFRVTIDTARMVVDPITFGSAM